MDGEEVGNPSLAADAVSTLKGDDLQSAPEPLGRRLGDWKTLASFCLAIVILTVVVKKGGFDPTAIWNRLHTAIWGYFLAGLVAYYATFPLRGLRWRLLLANAYRDTQSQSIADMHVSGLTEIIFISWFVNCVVPAKLGDLYRAYLAKLWQNISWVKTVGTVVAERIVDILVLAALLGASGLLAFHDRLGRIKWILVLALVLALVGIVVLTLMRRLSPWIRKLMSESHLERYAAFEEGTLLSLRRLPLLVGLTIPIWLLEGLRYWFMFLSLSIALPTHGFPYTASLFFALGTAVLTTVPVTPGGLGIVQSGLAGIMILLGVHKNDAGAVVVMDSLLSYWSIAIVGFVVYLLSRRSHFRNI